MYVYKGVGVDQRRCPSLIQWNAVLVVVGHPHTRLDDNYYSALVTYSGAPHRTRDVVYIEDWDIEWYVVNGDMKRVL